MFPQMLYDYWEVADDELHRAIKEGHFEGVKVSSLLKAYLDLLVEEPRVEGQAPPSLKTVVLARIIAELKASSDLQALVTHIAQTLDTVTYRQLLLDPKLPHRFLRAFLMVPHPDIPAGGLIDGRDIVDIDNAILANEEYLQRATESTPDDFHLVTLGDLKQILDIPDTRGSRCYKRKGPPKGKRMCQKYCLEWQAKHDTYQQNIDYPSLKLVFLRLDIYIDDLSKWK